MFAFRIYRNYDGAGVQGYQYSAQNLDGIEALPCPTLSDGGFSATYPAESITLWILPPAQLIQRVYLPLSRR